MRRRMTTNVEIKRKAVINLLFLSLFFISIGYANVNSNLYVNGEIGISKFNQYTVYFDSNGGSSPSFLTKKYNNNDEVYGELPVVNREGYTFAGWSRNKIGVEYQEVEYIESDGNQYIDTLVSAGDSKGLYAEVASLDVSNDSIYFGSKYGDGDNRFWIGNKDKMVYFGWNDNTFRSNYTNNNERFVVKFNYLNDRNSFYNDELITNYDSIILNSNNNASIFIFAGNNYSASLDRPKYFSKIRLYRFKITDNDEVINDFLPCYRKRDGEIGLYDVINNNFYMNKGTGSFKKGNDVNNYVTSLTEFSMLHDHTLYAIWGRNPNVVFDSNGGDSENVIVNYDFQSTYGTLPVPTREGYHFLGWNLINPYYQEVEYIESDGSQYIDTLVEAGNTKGVYAILSSSNVSNDSIYFGSKYGYGDTRLWVGNKDSQIYYGWNYNSYRSTNIVSNEINTISINYLNDRKSMFNDELINNFGNTELSSSNKLSLYIFAGNNNGPNYYSRIKLYDLKISDNNDIIRDFVPCYRKSDGKIGLFDKINSVFYTNQNTGEFVKGHDLSDGEFFSTGDINYINSDDEILITEDYTVYAVWEKDD